MDQQGEINLYLGRDSVSSANASVLQKSDKLLSSAWNPTGLGTLGQLPMEIRRQIWLEVLKGSFRDRHYPGPEPFRYLGGQDWTHFHFGTPDAGSCSQCYLKATYAGAQCQVFALASYDYTTGAIDIRDSLDRQLMRPVPRLISHYIKAEYEHVFLSTHSFAFESPSSLNMFLDLLPEYCQLPRLSIIPYNMTHARPRLIMESSWPKTCARLPGRGLTALCFRLGTHRHDSFPPSPHGYHMIRRSLAEVRLLRFYILKNVPDVRLSVAGPKYEHLTQDDRAAFDALLTEQVRLENGHGSLLSPDDYTFSDG